MQWRVGLRFRLLHYSNVISVKIEGVRVSNVQEQVLRNT